MSARRRINIDDLEQEFEYSASTSGGPGGQHANKVNTKVTLRFDVAQSEVLQDSEKDVILKKLSSRITKEGILVLSAQEERSQFKNKQAVLKKADFLLNKALAKRKPRKATKPTKTAIQNRLKTKKQQAEKKKWRQKPGF